MSIVNQTIILKTMDITKLPEIMDDVKELMDKHLDTKGAIIGYFNKNNCLIILQPVFKQSQAMMPTPQITGELKIEIKCEALNDLYNTLEKISKKIRDKCLIETE